MLHEKQRISESSSFDTLNAELKKQICTNEGQQFVISILKQENEELKSSEEQLRQQLRQLESDLQAERIVKQFKETLVQNLTTSYREIRQKLGQVTSENESRKATVFANARRISELESRLAVSVRDREDIKEILDVVLSSMHSGALTQLADVERFKQLVVDYENGRAFKRDIDCFLSEDLAAFNSICDVKRSKSDGENSVSVDEKKVDIKICQPNKFESDPETVSEKKENI